MYTTLTCESYNLGDGLTKGNTFICLAYLGTVCCANETNIIKIHACKDKKQRLL